MGEDLTFMSQGDVQAFGYKNMGWGLGKGKQTLVSWVEVVFLVVLWHLVISYTLKEKDLVMFYKQTV